MDTDDELTLDQIIREARQDNGPYFEDDGEWDAPTSDEEGEGE